MKLKSFLMTAAAAMAIAAPALADKVTLRIQTHYSSEHPTGKMLDE